MTAAHSASGVPSRLRRWILILTPVTWVALALLTYPKDAIQKPHRYFWEVGVRHLLEGFVQPTIANYPAWATLSLGVIVMSTALLLVVRRPKKQLPGVLVALGLLFVVWSLLSGGVPAWSPSGLLDGMGWLFQTLAILLVATVIWVWALENPERSHLMVWRISQGWKLFRSNWLGTAGVLGVLVFVSVALLAPFLAAHYYVRADTIIGKTLEPSSWSYYKILGLDDQGLSVLAEFIWSSRMSLAIGVLAAAISALLGASIGIAAGFYGRATGEVLMRLTDGFLAIPWLPFSIILATLFGTRYGILVLIIGATGWPWIARVVRSQTLSLRERVFVERAQAIGSSNLSIMRRHILPNIFPLIFANTAIAVAIAILAEAALSFVGLGDPLNFSWGSMLRNAWISGAMSLPAWAYFIPPGLGIVLVVLSFTFIGRALEEVLDPKLRKREEGGARPDQAAAAPAGADTEPARCTVPYAQPE